MSIEKSIHDQGNVDLIMGAPYHRISKVGNDCFVLKPHLCGDY